MAAICRSTIIKESTPLTSEWALRSLRNDHAVYVGMGTPLISEWLRRSVGICRKYPIYITRDLDKAKNWVKTSARGSERYGLFASSNAARLKPRGIYYAKDRSSLSPENWFLNGKDDIRSSYFLEAVASEFETQGLELDYAIVAWDADLRIENGRWTHNQMSNRLSPPNWSVVVKKSRHEK